MSLPMTSFAHGIPYLATPLPSGEVSGRCDKKENNSIDTLLSVR